MSGYIRTNDAKPSFNDLVSKFAKGSQALYKTHSPDTNRYAHTQHRYTHNHKTNWHNAVATAMPQMANPGKINLVTNALDC